MMHYEIEQAGAGDEHRPNVGTHAEPERWHVVNVLNADAAPMPLRFDTLDRALAYTHRVPKPLRNGGGRGGGRAPAGGHDHAMRRVAQAPAHYEVELRQPASGDG